MNPYWDKNFFEFFSVLFRRMAGQLPSPELASDEVQLLVLAGIGISCALIGVFLTLKKMTMLANSLSHTVLLGIALTYIAAFAFSDAPPGHLEISLPMLISASLASGLITTLATHLLTHVTDLQEDASIGLVFTTLFALGVVLVTVFTRSSHIGTEAVMGNVDALHADDLKLVASVLLFNTLFVGLFYRHLKITAFDVSFSGTVGISAFLLNNLLMLATAATAIAAFRAVGVILVLSFLVTPALIARRLTHSLKYLIPIACAAAVLCSCLSVALARHILSVWGIPLSTGGIVVTLMGLLYLLTLTRNKVLIPRYNGK